MRGSLCKYVIKYELHLKSARSNLCPFRECGQQLDHGNRHSAERSFARPVWFLPARAKTHIDPYLRNLSMSRLVARSLPFTFVAMLMVVSLTQSEGQVASPLYANEKSVLVVRTMDGAESEFEIVTVTEQADLERGLMYVKSLPLDQGMLFLYDNERERSMWMKNTFIALDLWFVSKHGEIKKVVKQAQPKSLDPIRSEEPVMAVIEVNGGLSAMIGVTPGSTVSHEAFERD